VARVLASGLRHRGKERGLIKEVMEEVGRREATWLERGVGVLGLIANIAPLLGLLGTVTGMIRVFQQVVAQAGADGGGQVNAGALANGIWEALITTAAGLAVAIPTFVMYKFLTGRIDAFLVELEERSLDLAESMVGGAALAPEQAAEVAEEPTA
jgi:biopolymer transport protein ExbB